MLAAGVGGLAASMIGSPRVKATNRSCLSLRSHVPGLLDLPRRHPGTRPRDWSESDSLYRGADDDAVISPLDRRADGRRALCSVRVHLAALHQAVWAAASFLFACGVLTLATVGALAAVEGTGVVARIHAVWLGLPGHDATDSSDIWLPDTTLDALEALTARLGVIFRDAWNLFLSRCARSQPIEPGGRNPRGLLSLGSSPLSRWASRKSRQWYHRRARCLTAGGGGPAGLGWRASSWWRRSAWWGGVRPGSGGGRDVPADLGSTWSHDAGCPLPRGQAAHVLGRGHPLGAGYMMFIFAGLPAGWACGAGRSPPAGSDERVAAPSPSLHKGRPCLFVRRRCGECANPGDAGEAASRCGSLRPHRFKTC